MSCESMTCVKKMSDHTGFHFYACGKPAKFRVWWGDGPAVTMCATHTNQARRKGANVHPLGKNVTNGGMKPTCPNCGHEPCAEWCKQ